MPQYLIRKDNTYYFRQGIPLELREILGRREIKRSLGRDYAKAVRECKRVAVEADSRLADAQARFDSIPIDPYSQDGIRRTWHIVLTTVTAELETQFGSLMREALLETDHEKRIVGFDGEAFREYGQHIQDALTALRRQLAMGDVSSLVNDVNVFLIARGYEPHLSPEDLRRLAYVMAQASLEAYEGMAARQEGKVVKPPLENVLVSQYELQNATRSAAACQEVHVTWQNLYDAWAKECVRPENTKSSYFAAMKLFISVCPTDSRSRHSMALFAVGCGRCCVGRSTDRVREYAYAITNNGQTLSSLVLGCSRCPRPTDWRVNPDEETTDWRARRGKTAHRVRREGMAIAVPYPYPSPCRSH